MKKILSILLSTICAALLLGTSFPKSLNAAAANEQTVVSEPTPIDMYLIAGQSNAAGYSPILDNGTETFENIMYSGMTNYVLCGNNSGGYYGGSASSDSTKSFSYFKSSITAGLGAYSNRIGPEYGMAKMMNAMYQDGNKAFIFKTAAGGTTLLDSAANESAYYGNWYPRSLWEEGYTPNINQYSKTNDPTGILYHLFVENFKRVYRELINNGYSPRVKGMAWMQGEQDIWQDLNEYERVLKTFISDIRNDLSQITGDNSLESMPFVIGEIAETFDATPTPPNLGAINMDICQRKVAAAMDGVETISTKDLIITGTDGNPMPGCPDRYHFCFKDAVTLGQRFSEKILELSGAKIIVTDAVNGRLTYTTNADESITFHCVPKEHYKLTKLTVSGKDVTEQVNDGTYTLKNPSKRENAFAEFEEKTRYTIEYTDLGKKGGYLRKAKYWYEGEKLGVKIFINDGYVLKKVTFNGTDADYNEKTGEYEILITEEGKIDVVISEIKNNNGDIEKNDTKESGCGSRISKSFCVIVSLMVVLAITLQKKKNGQLK